MIAYRNLLEYEPIAFYSYTSVIPSNARICVVDGFWNANDSERRMFNKLDKIRKTFMEQLAQRSGNKVVKFDDNKTVFKLRHKENDTILYFGYKDGIISIGTDYYQYFGSAYDAETNTWSVAPNRL